jgi:hypothetical protein
MVRVVRRRDVLAGVLEGERAGGEREGGKESVLRE